MSDSSYQYSTYGLASAIVLYVLKRLHESKCLVRDGVIQIQLGKFNKHTRDTRDTRENHASQTSAKETFTDSGGNFLRESEQSIDVSIDIADSADSADSIAHDTGDDHGGFKFKESKNGGGKTQHE
jgi:hypothetical protein